MENKIYISILTLELQKKQHKQHYWNGSKVYVWNVKKSMPKEGGYLMILKKRIQNGKERNGNDN